MKINITITQNTRALFLFCFSLSILAFHTLMWIWRDLVSVRLICEYGLFVSYLEQMKFNIKIGAFKHTHTHRSCNAWQPDKLINFKTKPNKIISFFNFSSHCIQCWIPRKRFILNLFCQHTEKWWFRNLFICNFFFLWLRVEEQKHISTN